MILRVIASAVVIALFVLNAMLPTAAVTARGSENRARQDFDIALMVGERLPPLTLFDLDGRRYTREDLAGHRVLITFERSVDW